MAEVPATRIAFDLRPLFGSNARRGIGRYTSGMASGLARLGVDVTFLVPPGVTDVPVDVPERPIVTADHRSLHRLAAAGPLIFHSPSLFEFPTTAPVIPSAISELGLPVTATLYDAIPYAEPERYQHSDLLRRFHQLRAITARSCDHLLAISEFAATSSIPLIGLDVNRVAVVGTGVDARFSLPTAPANDINIARSAFPTLRPEFVISVVGNDARKNGAGLIRGYGLLSAELRARHQLVVVGRLGDEMLGRWRALADEVGCREHEVLFTGEINDDLLVAMYRCARLCVFPSLNEGFGLPVAEAAACGCPTITSDRTSVPEVLDWTPSQFAGESPEAIAHSMQRGLTDDSFRADLGAAGRRAAGRWTWEQVALRAMDVWTSMADNSTSCSVPRPSRPTSSRPVAAITRPRLALVGPFAGSPSGIGTYNERLLGHLDEFADVTCFVESFQGEAPLGIDGRRFPALALGRHIEPDNFDHVVYTLGNSPFHLTSVIDLIPRITGVVWLHEAQLVELHVGTTHVLKNQPWGEQHLTRLIGLEGGLDMVSKVREPAGWESMLDIDRYHKLDVRLLGPTVERAQGIVVSSEMAAELVRPYQRHDHQPVLVLPHAFPAVDVAADLVADDGPVEIAVLGWMSVAKGVQRTVELLAAIREQVDARLVFVGRALDGSREALMDAAHAQGVHEAIEVCGFLPEAELKRRLRGCRVGLRLAERTDGEMSGAIADLISLQVPVVTNLRPMGGASPGLVVLPNATNDALLAAIMPLLIDDGALAVARADCRQRADAWSFRDVAQHLVDWLEASSR